MSNLAVINKQTPQYDEKTIDMLRHSLFPGAKKDSIIMVIEYCKYAQLDIMQKPVHIVPMWIVDRETGQGELRDTIMPGINSYRVQAARQGCAGISEPEFGPNIFECIGGVDITYPEWCKITVKRIIGERVVEFPAKEFWKENFAIAGKDKKTGIISYAPNAMWRKRTYGQLAKCTEAQAHRKAFPETCILPTAEEMEGKSLSDEEYEDIQKNKPISGKGMQGLKEKLNLVEEQKPKNVNEEIIDEIIEPVAETDNNKTIDKETFIFLLENASTIKELNDTMKNLKSLSPEDKKIVYALYKEKEAALKK